MLLYELKISNFENSNNRKFKALKVCKGTSGKLIVDLESDSIAGESA